MDSYGEGVLILKQISCYSYLAFSYIPYFNQQNTKIIKQIMKRFMLGTMS